MRCIIFALLILCGCERNIVNITDVTHEIPAWRFLSVWEKKDFSDFDMEYKNLRDRINLPESASYDADFTHIKNDRFYNLLLSIPAGSISDVSFFLNVSDERYKKNSYASLVGIKGNVALKVYFYDLKNLAKKKEELISAFNKISIPHFDKSVFIYHPFSFMNSKIEKIDVKLAPINLENELFMSYKLLYLAQQNDNMNLYSCGHGYYHYNSELICRFWDGRIKKLLPS